MFDPELYLARFKVTSRKTGQAVMRSGRYRDIATCGVSTAFTVAVIDSSCPIGVLATMDTEIMSPLLKSKRSKVHSLRSTMIRMNSFISKKHVPCVFLTSGSVVVLYLKWVRIVVCFNSTSFPRDDDDFCCICGRGRHHWGVLVLFFLWF